MYLTNRLHFPVVCSVIDTQYDVICGKNKTVKKHCFKGIKTCDKKAIILF